MGEKRGVRLLCRVAVVVMLAAAPQVLRAQTLWEVSLTGGYMTPNNFNMPEYSAWTVGGDVALFHRRDENLWWV